MQRTAVAFRLADWSKRRIDPHGLALSHINFDRQTAVMRTRLQSLLDAMVRNGPTPEALADYGDVLVPVFSYLSQVQQQRKAKAGIPASGLVVVDPGEALTFDIHGFCMDPNLPAPVGGERLALVDDAELIPVKVRPVFRAVLKYGNQQHTDHSLMQATVWKIRTLGSVRLVRNDPGPMRKLVDDAYPGGWSILADYADSILDGKEKKSKINSLAATVLGQTGLSDQLNGALASANAMVNQINYVTATVASIKAQTDAVMQLISAKPPDGAVPSDLSSLSRWQGLDASTRGTGVLAGSTIAVNTSDRPIVVDVSQLVFAQSERVSQRITGFPENPTLVPTSASVDPSSEELANKIANDAVHALRKVFPDSLPDPFRKISDACDLWGMKDIFGCLKESPNLVNFASARVKYRAGMEAVDKTRLAVMNIAHVAYYGTDMAGVPVTRWERASAAAMLTAGAGVAIGAVVIAAPEVMAAIGLESASASMGAAIDAAMGTGFREVGIQAAGYASDACTLGAPIMGVSNLAHPEPPKPGEQDKAASDFGWSAAGLADSIRDLGKWFKK